MTEFDWDFDREFDEVFGNVFGIEDLELSDGMTADDVDGWDSLMQINLVFALEQRFGVQLSDRQMANLANLGDLRAAIRSKL